MLTCEAHGCLSNENTKIEGKDILLFRFPEEIEWVFMSLWLFYET